MRLHPATISTKPDVPDLPDSYFWGCIALLFLAVIAVLIRVSASRRGL